MKGRIRLILGVLIIVLGVVGLSSVYTVHQSEQALVLQFGQVKQLVKEPGLHFKLPLVQNVIYFDKRILDYDAQAAEVPTSDQRQLVVDAFARYRIVDPLLFFQRVINELGMEQRLNTIINANLRAVFGNVPLSVLLTPKRSELMELIANNVKNDGKRFGIEVIDVRIKRLDLPEENSEAIFRRMQTRREQEARQIRAAGDADAKRIRAEADKEATIILANAKRESEITRGEGDGKAQRIYNEAYGRDADFYRFWESMNAYRVSLGRDTTRYIGPPTGDFFKYFGNIDGAEKGSR